MPGTKAEAAELTAAAMRFVLTSQLTLAGELIAALMRAGSLSLDGAADAMNNAADAITSPLDRSPGARQALLVRAVLEHANELRKMAADLRIAKPEAQ